jgi:hypothetical protein
LAGGPPGRGRATQGACQPPPAFSPDFGGIRAGVDRVAARSLNRSVRSLFVP